MLGIYGGGDYIGFLKDFVFYVTEYQFILHKTCIIDHCVEMI